MKKLYCFDFDGTLTYKDTMFLFLKFYNRRKFYFSFVKHVPLFILLKINLLEAEKVKRSFISSVLKGETKNRIQQQAHLFFQKYYPELIRRNALDFISGMDREKVESLIVTASLDLWVQPFADHFGMKLLATTAEFKDDIFTGNFVGINCNGDEKVNRILGEIKNKQFDKTIAFGDTKADQAMLNWADESHFRFFH